MFNEQAYLLAYPDVAAAVNAGFFSSGLQHYTLYGQFEENRVGFFFGTDGNDSVTGFGNGTKLIAGVSFDTLLDNSAAAGVGEVDVLTGTQGNDIFALGHPSLPGLTSIPQQFYVGGGNTDYAVIRDFEGFNIFQGLFNFFEGINDSILLEGPLQNYNIEQVNGNTNISTVSGDLVGIVEGVTSLQGLNIEAVDGTANIFTASGNLIDTVDLVDITNFNIPFDVNGSFSVLV